MISAEVAIAAWRIIAVLGAGAVVTVIGLWFWFIVLGKGDWS